MITSLAPLAAFTKSNSPMSLTRLSLPDYYSDLAAAGLSDLSAPVHPSSAAVPAPTLSLSAAPSSASDPDLYGIAATAVGDLRGTSSNGGSIETAPHSGPYALGR